MGIQIFRPSHFSFLVLAVNSKLEVYETYIQNEKSRLFFLAPMSKRYSSLAGTTSTHFWIPNSDVRISRKFILSLISFKIIFAKTAVYLTMIFPIAPSLMVLRGGDGGRDGNGGRDS